MRIRILSVGKPRDASAIELHDRYAERITRFGVRYESAWVEEVRPGGRYSDDHVREREADLLRERLDGRGALIALDPRGRTMASEELAQRLERWASPSATLVIGGPLGLHASLPAGAEFVWSFSPLTFPHELFRAMVAEQLYRALTILRGVPYHK